MANCLFVAFFVIAYSIFENARVQGLVFFEQRPEIYSKDKRISEGVFAEFAKDDFIKEYLDVSIVTLMFRAL